MGQAFVTVKLGLYGSTTIDTTSFPTKGEDGQWYRKTIYRGRSIYTALIYRHVTEINSSLKILFFKLK